jgi:hypothetical protein
MFFGYHTDLIKLKHLERLRVPTWSLAEADGLNVKFEGGGTGRGIFLGIVAFPGLTSTQKRLAPIVGRANSSGGYPCAAT